MTHAVLAAFVIASTLMVAACGDDGGTKDQNYGTDAAVGYTGPLPDASHGQTMDTAVPSNNAQNADTAAPVGVNDLGVTADIDDAASLN